MTRLEALVTPTLLAWARRTAGLDLAQAGKRTRVKPEKLEAWEAGDGHPSMAQMKRIAEVYKRPLAIFYLPAPPRDFKAMRDFRRLLTDLDHEFSPELLLEMRRARYRREVALELAKELDEVRPGLPVRAELSEDPENVALEIRRWVGVSIAKQAASPSEGAAFQSWKSTLEAKGILVFQFPHVAVSEARGFSISESELPAVSVNSRDAIRAKIFTLFHELAHLALHEEGVCDLEGSPAGNARAVEAFCNRVAAATLIPREDVLSLPSVAGAGSRKDWTDEDLKTLADRYFVSRESIILRLLGLGKTPQAFYDRKREELLKEYEEAAKRPRFGRSTPASKAVGRLGLLFTRLVLDAYHQETISASTVSDYLDIRLKHLGAVEKAAFGPEAIAV